jgi:hypothetical protein
MATATAIAARSGLNVEMIAALPNFRVVAWHGDRLYVSRGYDLYSLRMIGSQLQLRKVATYSPGPRRSLSSRFALSSRLFRDGFHALSVLPSGNLVAAVPGAIVTLKAGETEFQVTHKIARGTRPLHIATTPAGRMFWGEYFDNAQRSEVKIFGSHDCGLTWDVAHTFPARSVRHVHNIVYDRWGNCLWIFTGDYGSECKIIRASADLSSLNEVIAGNQQCRAVAAVTDPYGIYFASDTPLEKNYIYLLDRSGKVHRLQSISSSSIYGCRNRNGIFFSTMVEPSDVNRTRNVTLVGSNNGADWEPLASWPKDHWPMRLFQYGNAFLPDGDNTTDLLATTTIAVRGGADCVTTIWRTASKLITS